MSDDKDKKTPAKPSGVLLQAENGDVIRYDPTGLQMVLSDHVIADIDRRLQERSSPEAEDADDRIARATRGIDCWDVALDGEWCRFHARLPGRQGPRKFQRLTTNDPDASPPAIIACTQEPLIGLLGFGGQRRALGVPEPCAYPFHILAPGDEIGAVGMAGLESATRCDTLLGLTEMTREAFIAETLLDMALDRFAPLPLYLTRAETDSSATAADLASGTAFDNIGQAMANLKAAADRLGQRAELAAIMLDFGLEDISDDAESYQKAMLDLLDKLAAVAAENGFRRPPVLSIFDCGTPQISDGAILRAQWQLSWMGLRHGLIYAAPGYMFEQDAYARPTPTALRQMAEMQAHALAHLSVRDIWSCPTFLLAERENDNQIRVRAEAMGPLIIDTDAPFAVGPDTGFRLENETTGAKLTDVTIAPDDPQDIVLSFDQPPQSDGQLRLLYAFDAPARETQDGYPAAAGAIRDDWGWNSPTGATLHRWALPAVLDVH
ncbi:hypothetical protein [Pseudaestuariivita rosea]|uniref:hypothetical protein n=1 Tax=Pseudaestuariivita rosea TaxID=2763263 RepID=UPI001ABAC5FA|nr:hypothetical protein [Pseudaestuariivita rosea]